MGSTATPDWAVPVHLEPGDGGALGPLLVRACRQRGLNPAEYALAWPSRDRQPVTLYCPAKHLEPTARLIQRSRQPTGRTCRVALRGPAGRFEGSCSVRQSLWDMLKLSTSVRFTYFTADDSAVVYVPTVRIDGGAHFTDVKTLMDLNLEILGLASISSILLHVTHVPSDLSVATIIAMEERARTEIMGSEGDSQVPSVDVGVGAGSDEGPSEPFTEIRETDFSAWRTEAERKAGGIDRALHNLRKEVPAKTDLKTCLRTLRIITRNLLDHPEDARYRSLRVSNPALNTNVFQRDSAVKYLELIGFREEVDADGQPFRSCTDQINRDLLERALSIIERHYRHEDAPIRRPPAAVAAQINALGSTDVENDDEPVDRQLALYDEALGVQDNPKLSAREEEFIEEDPSDLALIAGAHKAFQRRAKFAELLVSKSYVREQMQAALHTQPRTRARIRVRIMRRFVVQATFKASETLGDVAEVVRSVLARPDSSFHFVLPPATILGVTSFSETLHTLHLVPSAILYLQFDSAEDTTEVEELLTSDAKDKLQKLTYDDVDSEVKESSDAPAVNPVIPRKPSSQRAGGTPAWFKKR
ncbi:PUB domain-containing protein [Plasmodiophora brassicae]